MYAIIFVNLLFVKYFSIDFYMINYKKLRIKTQNFVFLFNIIKILFFYKLLIINEHTMNIEIISFYVFKECKNM